MSPAPGYFTDDTKALASARNHGRCEVCNQRAAQEHHHRRPRGMGGAGRKAAPVTAGAANCLCLCQPCHDEAERRHRAAARERGVILRASSTPEEMPVMAYMGGRFGNWNLDNDGGYRPALPARKEPRR